MSQQILENCQIFRLAAADRIMHTDAPVKKKFESPNFSRKFFKSAISPKFRTNLKDFGKSFKQRGDLGSKHASNIAKKKLNQKTGKSPIPVKYHFGGNISDPLNLNELIDRDPSISITPQCSPAVSLVERNPDEVFEPVQLDAKDPLHLENASPFHQEDVAAKMKKKKKRKRNNSCHEIEEKDQENVDSVIAEHQAKSPKAKRKKSTSNKVEKSVKTEEKIDVDQEEVKESSPKKDASDKEGNVKKKKRKHEKKSESENETELKSENDNESSDAKKVEDSKECNDDKAVASTETKEKRTDVEKTHEKKEPTPTKHKKRNRTHSTCNGQAHQRHSSTTSKEKHPEKERKFIYGNYNRYYGYRNPDKEDSRLGILRQEWFNGKTVLDVGCNSGELTLAVAREYSPKLIIGNDIDGSLIKIANKNLQHYAVKNQLGSFPVSFAMSYGPLVNPSVLCKGDTQNAVNAFPHNVAFRKENFVPRSEKELSKEKPSFDTILCLSVTKWVQLNWGDAGLKRMFRKMFSLLRPGGLLILELQPFSSYRKRKNLTETIRQNFDNIHLMPEQFTDYLLSDEVGFAAYEILDVPANKSKGFQRPMYLFTKASESQERHHNLGDWY